MKKKLLSFIFAICLIVPCVFMLSACTKNEHKSYNITISQVEGATITANVDSAKEGEIVELEYELKQGYQFERFIIQDNNGNNIELIQRTYTFIMPNNEVTITAQIIAKAYLIEEISENGQGYHCSYSVVESAQYGSNVVVNITPDEGYILDYIRVSHLGTNDSISDEYDYITTNTFVMPSCNIYVDVNVKVGTYTITIEQNEGGIVTPSVNSQKYNLQVELDYNYNTGYELDKIEIYDEMNNLIDSNLYGQINRFNMPGKNVIIKPIFKKINYTISIDYTSNGNVVASQTIANYGDIITLTASPDKGYYLYRWHAYESSNYNNTISIINGQINMPAENIVIEAEFLASVYSINYILDGGSLLETNPQSYDVEDGNVVFNLPAKEGYNCLGWYDSSDETVRINSLNDCIENPKNYTLIAKYNVVEYNITYKSYLVEKADHGVQLVGSSFKPIEDIPASIVNEFNYPTTYTIEDRLEDCWIIAPNLEHFNFIDFRLNISGEKLEVIEKGNTGDIVIYLKYETITYNLNWIIEDGVENHINNDGTSVSYYTHKELYEPTKEGFTFVGWFTDSEFTNQITEIKNTTKDINLYAKFE